MTTKQKERNTVNTYKKKEILRQLRDSETAVMGALKTYEDQLASWKDNVIERFTRAVEAYDGTNHYLYISEFEPPRRAAACADYRIQNLNKTIARIEALAEDENGNIKIYRLDPLFDYLAYASCL